MSYTRHRIHIEMEQHSVALRQLAPDDADAMFLLISSNRKHLSQFDDLTSQKYPTVEAVHKSITEPENPSKIRFGIWVASQFVGTINIARESHQKRSWIGYWIGNEYSRQGFASAATRGVVSYASQKLGHREFVALVHPDNNASKKVLLRSGFRLATRLDTTLYFVRISSLRPRV